MVRRVAFLAGIILARIDKTETTANQMMKPEAENSKVDGAPNSASVMLVDIK